jgi:uncharacterized protein YegJ (DUF2314 family)
MFDVDPSRVTALLAKDAGKPSVDQICSLLRASGLEFLDISHDSFGSPKNGWLVRATLKRSDDAPLEVLIWSGATETTWQEHTHWEWQTLTSADRAAAKESRYSVVVEATYQANPLVDFHDHLKVLAAAAPFTVVLLDDNSHTPHSGEWLRDIIGATVPPAPANLFAIHAVFDEDDPSSAWLHTHGLNRCGCVELELLDVPRSGASALARVLNAVAMMFMGGSAVEPGEPFFVGAGLELIWFPWREGLEQVTKTGLGRIIDRDEVHRGVSGILFAAKRQKRWLGQRGYANVSSYLPILRDNPVLYVSHMETARMKMLANERLRLFETLQQGFGARDDWLFLVKLGYAIDGAESELDKEHMWFQVHHIARGEVDATLLNEPHSIERMSEGQRAKHSLDQLSDWAIMNEMGRFNPDTISHLMQAFGRSATD